MMSREGASARSAHSVILRHALGAAIVFGLDWMPVVGGETEKLGLRRARSLRATHFLLQGEPGAIVGCGAIQQELTQIKRSGGAPSHHMYSAAAMFAAAHAQGVVAGVFHRPEFGYWLVAVNAGRVLAQTDRWYATSDETDAALLTLSERFPSLRVLPMAVLLDAELPDWVTEPFHEGVRLKKLSALGARLLRQGLTVVLMSAGIYGLWIHFSPAPTPPLQSPERTQVQWKDVMARFINQHPIHRPAHLFKVLEAWQKTPLNPGGWKLNQILCESSNSDWHCAARYQRLRKLARSEQLDAAKPNGWTLDLIDIDHAVLRWQVLGAASLFDAVSPTPPLKAWMSYLQGVTPVFESIQIGSGTQITLPAPLDEQGVALPRPAFIKPLKRRSLSIKGPLRSMVALRGLSVPVRWKSLHLEVGGTPRGQGISRSELMVQLLGEVFEISE